MITITMVATLIGLVQAPIIVGTAIPQRLTHTRTSPATTGIIQHIVRTPTITTATIGTIQCTTRTQATIGTIVGNSESVNYFFTNRIFPCAICYIRKPFLAAYQGYQLSLYPYRAVPGQLCEDGI